MESSVRDRQIQPGREQFEDIDPQQADAHIQTFPAQMVYEAKWALQELRKLKDSGVDPRTVVAILEPLARAVGWAEALIYSSDKFSEGQAIKKLVASGQYVSVDR